MVFLNILTPWAAIIVGEAALSLIVQEPSLCDTNFKVAIGNLYFESFLDNLGRLFLLGSSLQSRLDRPSPEGFSYHRHITRIMEFRLMTGLFITGYESSTPAACDVLSGSWTTALMNFATAYSIGCAYPRLTLNNYALLCDTQMTFMEWSERNVQGRLAVYGFHWSRSPDRWSLHARGPRSTSQPSFGECSSSIFVCPWQGRFFGDSGSLVLFCDGLSVDLEVMRDLCVAPYGPMVAWRLASTSCCKGGCVNKDNVLPPFIVSMLIQFMENTTAVPPTLICSKPLCDTRTTHDCASSPRLVRRYSV